MKNVLYGLALAGAALAFAACGGSTAQPAGEQPDSVQAAAPAEAALPAIAKTIDQKGFTLGLPEGWSVLSEEETEAIVYKGDDPTKLLDSPMVMFDAKKADGTALADAFKQMVSEMGAKEAADVTVGETVYKACTATENGVQTQVLVAEQDGNFAVFSVTNATADDADVKAIIASAKLK